MKRQYFFRRQLSKSIAKYGVQIPTSDMFLWPLDNSYKVSLCFRHLDLISNLFDVQFCHYLELLDQYGNVLLRRTFYSNELNDISEVIFKFQRVRESKRFFEFGSFSLFSYDKKQSFPKVSERTLISYSSSKSFCFMHGNLNERALILDRAFNNMKSLANIRKLLTPQEYFLPIHYFHSYERSANSTYNGLVIKNPLDTRLSCVLRIFCVTEGKLVCEILFSLHRKQIQTIDLTKINLPQINTYYTLAITSKIFMLRPILLTVVEDVLIGMSHS